ncbi:conjugal transfer protein [Streptomyces sp. NPDC056227]|uniref:conjugal transfer protein n=1 Tax=Streptomyces sp. NPDC056227 TaxID=3345753 RepID=UPI0035DBB9CD
MESTKKKLTKVQAAVLGLALVPMIAVGAAGGVGTYSNISSAYGSGTAIGALAAGEGATAVLAFILLGVTLLGQSAPQLVRVGLWALPGVASVMGATAATEGAGQTIVYAATPMAMTAAAEGLAFLARRIVVHQDGRDVEAEARAASVIRDLAYHQARAAAHPSKRTRKRSVRISWKLARRVGTGDVTLGADLLSVQHGRLVAGADVALARMFTPGLEDTAPAILTASADAPRAILPASAGDVTTSRAQESTVRADTSGYPHETSPEQAEEDQNARPALSLVRAPVKRAKSLAADVRQMVKDGVDDVRVITDALATRHGREADDPKFKATVGRSFRAARAALEDAPADTDLATGQYL